MNNFDYQMFMNGTDDGLTDLFLGETILNNANTYNNQAVNNNEQPFKNIPANNILHNNNINNSNLFSPYEGFTKGNMLKNLYEPFMNYKPMRLTPKNEQEEALLNLDQMHFAMHELNLYLDNYPNDTTMINKFNEFRSSYEKLLNDYQAKYGPIEITSPYMTTSPFAWTNDVWPWDRRKF